MYNFTDSFLIFWLTVKDSTNWSDFFWRGGHDKASTRQYQILRHLVNCWNASPKLKSSCDGDSTESSFDVAASASSVPPNRAGETEFCSIGGDGGAQPRPCCFWCGLERGRMEMNQEAEGEDPERQLCFWWWGLREASDISPLCSEGPKAAPILHPPMHSLWLGAAAAVQPGLQPVLSREQDHGHCVIPGCLLLCALRALLAVLLSHGLKCRRQLGVLTMLRSLCPYKLRF